MKIKNKFMLFVCVLSLLAQPIRAMGNTWIIPDEVYEKFRTVETWPIYGEEVFEQCWKDEQPCSEWPELANTSLPAPAAISHGFNDSARSGSREEPKTRLLKSMTEKSQVFAPSHGFNNNAYYECQGASKTLQPTSMTSYFQPSQIPHGYSAPVDSNNFRNLEERSPAEYFNSHVHPMILPPFGGAQNFASRSSDNAEVFFPPEENARDTRKYEENPDDASSSGFEEPEGMVLQDSKSPVFGAFILCAYLEKFAYIVDLQRGEIFISDPTRFAECSFKYDTKKIQAYDARNRIKALGTKFNGYFDTIKEPIRAIAKNSSEFYDKFIEVKQAYREAISSSKSSQTLKRKQPKQKSNNRRKKRRNS